MSDEDYFLKEHLNHLSLMKISLHPFGQSLYFTISAFVDLSLILYVTNLDLQQPFSAKCSKLDLQQPFASILHILRAISFSDNKTHPFIGKSTISHLNLNFHNKHHFMHLNLNFHNKPLSMMAISNFHNKPFSDMDLSLQMKI